MSKTLEQVVLALPCDGATTLAIIGALKEAGLADATVYGLCETCGGSRKCKRCDGEGKWFYELELKMIPCDACNGTGACPDCTMVSVVTKELRERAIEEAGRAATLNSIEAHCMAREPLEDVVDAVLSTVHGKTRVAKEVWCLSAGGEVWPTCKESRWLERGDTIAILEDDE